MTELIRTKIYLLDAEHLPESFQQFLKHAAQFECLHRLWTEVRVQSDDIQGIEYPKSFKQDVERSLDKLRARYNREIGASEAIAGSHVSNSTVIRKSS
jgi:hypothetical protein